MPAKPNYGRTTVRPRFSDRTRNDVLLVLSMVVLMTCLTVLAIYFPE
jgi:hypothetical protein